MSDFSYDSYDQTAVKVAFQNYRQAENQGFTVGLLALPITYFLFKKFSPTLTLNSTKGLFVPLFTSSIIYGLFTFNARNSYEDVAAKMNRKYSKIINQTLNY